MVVMRFVVSLWTCLVLLGVSQDVFLSSLAAPEVMQLPEWTARTPDPHTYLGGFTQIPGVELVELAHASLDIGTYNHAAMIDYFDGRFLVAWKNGPTTEDKAGQRILYSQSLDGRNWTKTDGSNELFPDMTTKHGEVKGKGTAALFVGPPIHINGRQYVGASPGQPTGASNGAQFCLWPDPINPRNTVGDKPETDGTLLMRQVLPGLGNFGPIFWAERSIPPLWAEASQALGFKLVSEMDAQTQADIVTLRPDLPVLPCDPKSGTLKCEACLGGCPLYSKLPSELKSNTRHERTHYRVPGNASDVVLWRSYTEPILYASIRANETSGQQAWGSPMKTNIPNDKTNINTGALPDGRVYLLSNPVFWSKEMLPQHVEWLTYRDPITLATSRDGWNFDSAAALLSCAVLTGSNETCKPRWCDRKPNDSQPSCNGKNPGPSYPQGLTVVAPAPEELRGFYVVASLNKEDIWLARVPFSSF